jgi:enoyl-CoA hydratase/carnithine racemase
MPLLCDRRGAVAVLTLSRPEARNAWCEEFQTGLVQCCRNWNQIPTCAA